jgi:hypothetical protein
MKFDKLDFDRGYKVCDVCKERIFQLEAGFDCEESLCERCNCFTVKKEHFHVREGVDILSKG